MGHVARGEVWIPQSVWLEFVTQYAPKSSGEFDFGPPREENGEIVVPFAVNTECNPAEEAEPPEWIKERE